MSGPALIVVDVQRAFDLARVTATNLHDELATVIDTATAVSES